jgi:hypothetical protein
MIFVSATKGGEISAPPQPIRAAIVSVSNDLLRRNRVMQRSLRPKLRNLAEMLGNIEALSGNIGPMLHYTSRLLCNSEQSLACVRPMLPNVKPQLRNTRRLMQSFAAALHSAGLMLRNTGSEFPLCLSWGHSSFSVYHSSFPDTAPLSGERSGAAGGAFVLFCLARSFLRSKRQTAETTKVPTMPN